MKKYRDNLEVVGNKVFSYNTHVATIEGDKLVRLGWWSRTTSKHINYVAKQYGLTVVDMSPEQKAEQKKEEEAQASSMMRTVGLIAKMGEFFTDNQAEANDWKARMLKAGLSGLSMPDDWGTLSEDEKTKRLDAVIAVSQEKQPDTPEKWLYQLFEAGKELNDDQRASLAYLLGSGCRQHTKSRLMSICKYSLDRAFRGKWFSQRIYFTENIAHYCAGQSYPDEIRSIRQAIL